MSTAMKRALSPLVVLSLVLLLGVIGCSKTGTVTGKVLYGGEVLPVGTVTITPEDSSKRAVVVEIENGEFKAEKVPPGPVIVTVSTKAARGEKNRLDSGQTGPGGGGLVGGGQTAKDIQKKKDVGMVPLPGDVGSEEKIAEARKRLENMIDVPDQYMDEKKAVPEQKFTIKAGSQEIIVELPKVDEKKPGNKPK